jgi:hypothetical protein
MRRSAIALLVSITFLVAILSSLAISIKYSNDSTDSYSNTKVLLQVDTIAKDVEDILKKYPNLNNAENFANMIENSKYIEYTHQENHIKLRLYSARSKLSIKNIEENQYIRAGFVEYLRSNGVIYPENFVAMIVGKEQQNDQNNQNQQNDDKDSKDKENTTNKDNNKAPQKREATGIVATDTEVYIKIDSSEGLQKSIKEYVSIYGDFALLDIDFSSILSYKNTKVDINYISLDIAKILLPNVDENILLSLVQSSQIYTEDNDIISLGIPASDMSKISSAISYFEGVFLVDIEYSYKNRKSYIYFEYNIDQKKGEEFEFFI